MTSLKDKFKERTSMELSSLLFFIITFIAFITIVYFGYTGKRFVDNIWCIYYFGGCNVLFWGYDGIMHFTSGTVFASGIIVLATYFPKFNFFRKNFWKNLVLLLALCAFLAFLWEVLEYYHDIFRIVYEHQDLYRMNYLDQPNNSDTMGDMVLAFIGSFIPAYFLQLFSKEIT